MNDLEIFTENQGETTGVTCTCKGGTTCKFQKIEKVLQTLQNFYDIIKKYFFHEIIYFGRKKHLLNDLEIFTQNQRGDHRRHLHLQRGDNRKISKNSKSASNPSKLL